MRTTYLFTMGLAAISCALLPSRTLAEHEPGAKLPDVKHAKTAAVSASQLIGRPVMNDHDEQLGTIQDIIVDTSSGKAPYAIISLNKAVSSTRNRIAVPFTELECGGEAKSVMLRATPEALRSSTKNLSGEWTAARDADWSQKVDGFYGGTIKNRDREAVAADLSRDPKEGRTFVRDPAPKGGELLITPDDAALADRICENVDVVHVRVQNGVTHLYGSVPSEQARRELETRVRGVQGVNTLESHLRVRNP